VDLIDKINKNLDMVDDLDMYEMYAVLGQISKSKSKTIRSKLTLEENDAFVHSPIPEIVSILKDDPVAKMRSADCPSKFNNYDNGPRSSLELTRIDKTVMEVMRQENDEIAKQESNEWSVSVRTELNSEFLLNTEFYIPIRPEDFPFRNFIYGAANVKKMESDFFSYRISRLESQMLKSFNLDEWFAFRVNPGVQCVVQSKSNYLNVVTEYGQCLEISLPFGSYPWMARAVLAKKGRRLCLDFYDYVNNGENLEKYDYDTRYLLMVENLIQFSGLHYAAVSSVSVYEVEITVVEPSNLTMARNFVDISADYLFVRNNHNYRLNPKCMYFVSSRSRFEIQVKSNLIFAADGSDRQFFTTTVKLKDGRYYCQMFDKSIFVISGAWNPALGDDGVHFQVDRYKENLYDWRPENRKMMIIILLMSLKLDLSTKRIRKIRRRFPPGKAEM